MAYRWFNKLKKYLVNLRAIEARWHPTPLLLKTQLCPELQHWVFKKNVQATENIVNNAEPTKYDTMWT